MDNKVVTTVARALRAVGVPTVRFNFRGVGTSTGTYDAGNGETDDMVAAITWGANRWPNRPVIIAGFSFGAYVALKVAQRVPAALTITVAPPVQSFDFAPLRPPAAAWLLVQGDADEVVDSRAVLDWVETLDPRPGLVVMPGVGHFFHGRLNELREVVQNAALAVVRSS